MRVLSRLKQLFVRSWVPILGWLAAVLGVGFLLFFHLKNLVPGFSQPEFDLRQQSGSLHAIAHNPLNAPYKLLEYISLHFHHHGALALRTISVLCTFIISWSFYYVLRRWHTQRMALLGGILFITSSWLLQVARLATTDIMLLLPVTAIAFGTWIRQAKASRLVIIIGVVIASIMLYVPGLVWFVILGAIWQSRELFRHYKLHPIFGFVPIALGVGLLAPLGYGLYLHPELIKVWAGFPAGAWPQPLTILKNLIHIPYYLILHGPYDPIRWLGHLPLLDIFTVTMAALGVYAYFFQRKLDRTKLLIGGLVIGSLLISLGGSVNIVVLLPFIYLLAVGGVTLMLQQWFTVFPLNPVARIIGTTLISLVVLLACFYHLNHYFIAWPNDPATKQAFHIHP